MPTTVYTLLCQTDRTGQVLGVFAGGDHDADGGPGGGHGLAR